MRRSKLHGRGAFLFTPCAEDAELAKVVGTGEDFFGMIFTLYRDQDVDMIGSNMGDGQDTLKREAK